MNLSVSFAHFILEGPYADIIRTSVCILLGVNQPLLFFIIFIDGTWGAFIHVGEMPPGWSHIGDHKTSRVVRREWEESQAQDL